MSRRGTYGCLHWSSCQIVMLFAIAASTAPAMADERAERPLTALVADDVGLCIEVDNLATRVAEFQASELYRRLADYAPLRKFLAENRQTIASLAGVLHLQTGLTGEELLDKLFGKRILVAVWPCAIDDSPGPAMLLLECEDARLLANVLTRVLNAEREAGRNVVNREWRREGRACAIHCIETGDEHAPLFVAVADRLAIVATDEQAVENALELHSGISPKRSLAERPIYVAGMRRLNPQAVARVFVNPRAWDALLAAQPAAANDSSHGSARWLTQEFQASEYLVGSIEIGRRIAVECFLQKDAGAVRPGSHFVETPAERRDLADRLPADAVAALAGRVDLAALFGDFFSEHFAPDQGNNARRNTSPQKIGAALGAMLLDEHGHDAVAALVPRQSKLPSAQVRHREHSSPTNLALPADWIVGFDSRSLLPESRLSLAQRLDPMLRTAVTAAIIMYNRQGQAMSIESVEEQGVPLTTVQGLALFGKGSTATFASQNGYFWAGTSRGIVRDMARIVPADSLATAAHFRALANPRLEDRSHLAYLDLEALRSLVARTASDASASSTGGASAPQDAPGRAGVSPTLSDLLGLADRMLVEIGIDGSGIRIAATVATSAGQ